MGDKSRIEWTDATWNPIVGCSKVSPGCDHCYAISVVHRGMSVQHRGLTVVGDDGVDWNGDINVAESVMMKPLEWRRPRRIFVNSLSDLFYGEVDDLTQARIIAVMSLAPQHTFQVLTKRPKAMQAQLTSNEMRYKINLERRRIMAATRGIPLSEAMPWPLPNVWWGVSIESNRYAFRADYLRDTPAAVRWISAEPLVDPLDQLDLTGIDWVVAGGESGPGARPMHPEWVRDLRNACEDRPAPCEIPDVPRPHSVPVPGGGRACACEYPDPVAFHFKQWGDWMPYSDALDVLGYDDEVFTRAQREVENGRLSVVSSPVIDRSTMIRVGKKRAGRTLDGRTWDEYPEAP